MIQRILFGPQQMGWNDGTYFLGFINIVRPLVTCLLGLIVYHWLDVMHQGPSLLPR